MSYALLDDEATQLACAIRSAHISDVEMLLEAGVDVNSADKNGETGLHVAAWYGRDNMVQTLLNAGVNVNTINKNGQTALHIAATSGCDGIVKLLVDAMADINAKTKYTEMTGLHLASLNGHTEVVRVLLNAGADTEVTDAINKTADFYAGNQEISDMFKTERRLQGRGTRHAAIGNNFTEKLRRLSQYPTVDHDTEYDNATEADTFIDTRYTSRGINHDTENGTITTAELTELTDINNQLTGHKNKRHKKRRTKKSKHIIQHSLRYSEEHEKRMQLNVFDRLTKRN